MSEEEVETSEQPSETREYSETEQKAIQMGWNPEFEGDENKRAVSAEEFVDREKLYNDLRKRGEELRKQKEEIQALKESHKKIAQQSYDRALKDLQKEKKDAYEEGDTDKVVEIDEKIRSTEKERDDQEKQVDSSQDSNPEMQAAFQRWVEANPWYGKDIALTGAADKIGEQVQKKDPDIINRPDEFLKTVVDEVKKEFPDRFKGEKRKNPVEGEKSTGSGKKKHSLKDIPEEDRNIAKRVMEMTGKSEQDYLAEYFGEQK